jgi:hypothetical protein
MLSYDIPAYTRGRGAPAITHIFEGRLYTYLHMDAHGAAWRAENGDMLYTRDGTVMAWESGAGDGRWCSLIDAVDGVRVEPVYGRRDEDISEKTLRGWIAGR